MQKIANRLLEGEAALQVRCYKASVMSDEHTCAVYLPLCPPNEYLSLQMATWPDAQDVKQGMAGVYLELNDQSRSGYDLVSRIEFRDAELCVQLTAEGTKVLGAPYIRVEVPMASELVAEVLALERRLVEICEQTQKEALLTLSIDETVLCDRLQNLPLYRARAKCFEGLASLGLPGRTLLELSASTGASLLIGGHAPHQLVAVYTDSSGQQWDLVGALAGEQVSLVVGGQYGLFDSGALFSLDVMVSYLTEFLVNAGTLSPGRGWRLACP